MCIPKGFVAALGALLVLALPACMQKETVYVDLKTYQDDPQVYRGKELIIRTSVEELASDPSAFAGKTIQFEAPVVYFSGPQSRQLGTWDILVGTEGQKVKCSGDSSHFGAMHLVWKASVEEKKILIEGDFSYDPEDTTPLHVRIDRLGDGPSSVRTRVYSPPTNVYPYSHTPQYPGPPSLSSPNGGR